MFRPNALSFLSLEVHFLQFDGIATVLIARKVIII